MKFVPAQFLTPEDLGINLEEDSGDIPASVLSAAIDTETMDDFVNKAREKILGHPGETPKFELRRKGGILFCRLTVGQSETTFKVEWLRKS